MSGVLLIGPEEETALKLAMELARKRPVTLEQIRAHAHAVDQSTDVLTLAERGNARPERYVRMVELPRGYRVNISFEQQPAGLCLHLSMSTSAPDKLPHPAALQMVLQAMGIDRHEEARTWVEEFEVDGKPGGRAVNIVVLMEG